MNSLYNQLNSEPRMFQQPTAQGNNLQYIQMMKDSLRNSANPQATLQSIIKANPRYQNVMNFINQNGGNPRTAFYNLAQQRGIDPSQILSLLNLR